MLDIIYFGLGVLAALPSSPLPSAAWSGCDMPIFDLILGAAVAVGLFVYLGARLVAARPVLRG